MSKSGSRNEKRTIETGDTISLESGQKYTKLNQQSESQWPCQRCTLINSPSKLKCEACGNAKKADKDAASIVDLCNESSSEDEAAMSTAKPKPSTPPIVMPKEDYLRQNAVKDFIRHKLLQKFKSNKPTDAPTSQKDISANNFVEMMSEHKEVATEPMSFLTAIESEQATSSFRVVCCTNKEECTEGGTCHTNNTSAKMPSHQVAIAAATKIPYNVPDMVCCASCKNRGTFTPAVVRIALDPNEDDSNMERVQYELTHCTACAIAEVVANGTVFNWYPPACGCNAERFGTCKNCKECYQSQECCNIEECKNNERIGSSAYCLTCIGNNVPGRDKKCTSCSAIGTYRDRLVCYSCKYERVRKRLDEVMDPCKRCGQSRANGKTHHSSSQYCNRPDCLRICQHRTNAKGELDCKNTVVTSGTNVELYCEIHFSGYKCNMLGCNAAYKHKSDLYVHYTKNESHRVRIWCVVYVILF